MPSRQLRFDLGSQLFFGDNLPVLRKYVPDESVDLVYLDPPFNKNRSFNAIFKHVNGTPAAAQIKAFDDTWTWSIESEITLREVVEAGGQMSKTLLGMREVLGTSDMFAYLVMMAPRLQELHRVMKPSASLYLHCDPTASHYLKVLLDATFGVDKFRNELVWHYTGWNKNMKDHFESRHDVLFFYSKSKKQKFPGFTVPWASEEEYVKVRKQKVYTETVNGTERKYVMSDAGKGKRVRRWLDEAMAYGRPIDDVWDIDKVNNSSKESVGYPTQKPLTLLERIIESSTEPNDLVLDPFCGCGTAIDAAERLGRRWSGIDITSVAIEVIQKRLGEKYPHLEYALRGIPPTMEEVDFLAERDKFAFQQWVCDMLGIDADVRKGADKGIDAEIVRYDLGGETWKAIVSVKGGGVNVTQIRDLRGTVEREGADVGIFVTRKPPTRPMTIEAAEAGITDKGHPRLQILTAADLLAGKLPIVPAAGTAAIREVPATEVPDKAARKAAPAAEQARRQSKTA